MPYQIENCIIRIDSCVKRHKFAWLLCESCITKTNPYNDKNKKE
jgi:hypothetical protein